MWQWKQLWPLFNTYPWALLVLWDISWQVELWQTPQHHTKKLMLWKKIYVTHVPWVKVINFVVGEENRGDV